MRHAAPALVVESVLVLVSMLVTTTPAYGAKTRTFLPRGAALSLELPADWQSVAPERGWRFEAAAPGGDGWAFLSVAPAEVDLASFRKSFVAFERTQAAKLGPHVIIRVHSTSVGLEPAIEVVATAPGTMGEEIYGFQHGGLEYVLLYATPADQLARDRLVFAASFGSVRFLAPH